MSEGVTKDWTVNAVREGDVVDNPPHGDLQKFYVDFEGSDDTYWRRKAGDVPEVGKSYYGTITEGKYGPMFRKEKPQGGQGGGSSNGASGGSQRPWQPESERDPERAARILRQHSQELALRYHAMVDGDRIVLDDVFNTADLFDQDANEAGHKAAQDVGSTGTLGGEANPDPGPAQLPDLTTIEQALEANGLVNSFARSKVASYMLSQLEPERVVSAMKGLGDGVEATLTALIGLTERWVGEPLPLAADDADDDIPF